jgi:biotin/methionine sulfoxide reductase
MAARRTRTATHWGNYIAVSEGGRVVAVEPAPEDENPSPIGDNIPGAFDGETRIRRPAVRRGWLENGPRKGENRRGREDFVEVSWDDAASLVAAELHRVIREHGNEAIFGGSYGWGSAGRFHHPQSQIHRFLNLAGGYTYSVNTYSTAALEVILPHVIGGDPYSIFQRSPTWSEIAADGELIVAFGGLALKNTQINSGGLGRHDVASKLRACCEAGVGVVNVSPLRSDVADFLGAEWVPIRPNTDTALMLGIAHELIATGRHDREFLDRCCVGFERVEAYVLGESDGVAKTPEWASPITGVPTATVRSLAARIAERRTVISASWSLQRAEHGEQPYWAAVTLAAMSGSLGRPGGGFGAGYGAEHAIGSERRRWPIPSLSRPPNEVKTFIPVARVADMLLEPGGTIDYDGRRITYPDIRIVYWCGGNPFHHHQDLNRFVEAWQMPETIVVHEPYWSPPARFADIVLPAATFLERTDFAAGIADPWLSVLEQAVEPPFEAKTDYEILTLIAAKLGIESEFTEGRSADEWVDHLYEQLRSDLGQHGHELPSFDELRSAGQIELPSPPADVDGDFAALRADPNRYPVETPSGKIELYSDTIASFGYPDCPPQATWLEPSEWLGANLADRFPLHLVSNQPSTRLHSQLDNGAHSRASKVANREPIVIHPADAAARKIRAGDVVRVFNDRGACLAGATISDTVCKGVVQLATGAWFDPTLDQDSRLDRHGNPNVLTFDRGTSRLAQGPSAMTALVQIERVAEPPPVEIFHPPALGAAAPEVVDRARQAADLELRGCEHALEI